MKKNISFFYGYETPYHKRIDLIEQAGFDGVLIYGDKSLSEYIDLLFCSKLNIEALHLPYNGIVNELWKEGSPGDEYVDNLIDYIYFAKKYTIKKVIAHISGSDNPPPYNETGINRINKILNVCSTLDINLCLENLRRLDYLKYVFENIKNDRLRFCFDAGHASAFTKNIYSFPWNLYAEKLECTHLHDNNGIEDMHLLPFDGIIDWSIIINQLIRFNRKIELTIEIQETAPKIHNLNEADFLNLCFTRLLKIESLINTDFHV